MFTFTRAINDVGGQTTVTFTGTITSGQFDGAHAVEQAVIPTLDTAKCLAHPRTHPPRTGHRPPHRHQALTDRVSS